MSDIFISYAREDRDHAKRLAEALEAQGWSVWWDRTIPAGKSFYEVIEKALSEAKCVVVIWSNSSKGSDWVREEAEEGKRKRILVPVLTEKVTPPLGFRSLQAESLAEWDGDQTSPTFLKLVKDISLILGAPPIKMEAETEKAKQEAITNSIGMKFVLIPEGTFMMGSGLSPEEVVAKYGGEAKWFKDEHPQHKVTISQPFYLQTTEVTQGQWKRVMEDNPSDFKDCGEDCPVENVSWNGVQEFIGQLNKIKSTEKYRLPTEAEWEYACRAGSAGAFCFGDSADQLGDYAWYEKNSQNKAHPVAQKKPNAWRLYDMHGNVWEWCQDWFGDYPPDDVSDPKGPSSGAPRVLRGGAFCSGGGYVRCACRRWNRPGGRGGDVGFRVVLSP